MRVGVVADTHVPILAPKIPDTLWRGLEGCDYLIHAGDFHVYSVYEQFASRFPMTAVIGNRDEFPESEDIPEKQLIELEGFTIGVTHGFGPPRGTAKRVVKSWKAPPPDLLIFGHSHEAGVSTINDCQLLNPGSPTDYISSEERTYAILELRDEIQIQIHHLEEE